MKIGESEMVCKWGGMKKKDNEVNAKFVVWLKSQEFMERKSMHLRLYIANKIIKMGSNITNTTD